MSRLKDTVFISFIMLYGFFSFAAAQSENVEPQSQVVLPVYISKVSALDNFSLFANSGWDGNWYVGGNTCWIQKLVLPEKGDLAKIFVGAKLGRMKSQTIENKPPQNKKAIAGDIYVAVSSTPAWNNSDTFFLVDSVDICLEGDAENAINGTGPAHWFWREIPLEKANFGGENFIALYSNNVDMNSIANSPVLAAAWGDKESDTWLNDSIVGVPPKDPAVSLKTGISYFEPAIAVKLVPVNNYRVSVGMVVSQNKTKEGDEITASAFVAGVNIEKAWLEFSVNSKKWERLSTFAWEPPYQFVINKDNSPSGKYFIRAVAVDEFGNKGYSAPLELASENK